MRLAKRIDPDRDVVLARGEVRTTLREPSGGITPSVLFDQDHARQ